MAYNDGGRHTALMARHAANMRRFTDFKDFSGALLNEIGSTVVVDGSIVGTNITGTITQVTARMAKGGPTATISVYRNGVLIPGTENHALTNTDSNKTPTGNNVLILGDRIEIVVSAQTGDGKIRYTLTRTF